MTRLFPLSCVLSLLSLAACSSADGDDSVDQPAPDDEMGAPSDNDDDSPASGFPETPEGYTRIEVPTMPNLAPGSDTMYCQYVYGPLDHDVDILDITGSQGIGGHHAVAYATSIIKPIGTSAPCEEDDNLAGGFLGGIGGEGGGNIALPEGVAFRLPAGQAIMLNTHFLNTTANTIDGETVLDVKFVDTDPNRKIASLFVNGNFSFEVPPMGQAQAVAECTLPRDMELIMLANHLHDFGSHIWTDLTRAGSETAELIHEDPEWTYEMQFNPNVRKWSPSEPLVLHEGDTLRTHCNWNNTTEEMVTFPREMCIGVGYFLGDGTTSPICFNGTFAEQY